MNFVEFTNADTGKPSLHNADDFLRLEECETLPNRIDFRAYSIHVSESYDEAADRIVHAFPDADSNAGMDAPAQPKLEDIIREQQRAFNRCGCVPSTMPSEGIS